MDTAVHPAPAVRPIPYERRRPEETTLYQLVQEHLETFLAQVELETGAGLPEFVSCTYRIALGPRAGQEVLSFQTISTREPPPTPLRCVDAQGFSLHAEVCCAAHERKKLESQAQGSCLLGAPRTQHCAATSPAPPLPTSALHSTGPDRWCSH